MHHGRKHFFSVSCFLILLLHVSDMDPTVTFQECVNTLTGLCILCSRHLIKIIFSGGNTLNVSPVSLPS